MPLTGFNDYLAQIQNNEVVSFAMSASLARATRLAAPFFSFTPAISIPTASISLDRTTRFALNESPSVSAGKKLCILGARLSSTGSGGAAFMVCDLLNASGGLDATLGTAQTTNLPTAALSRYTSGVGVCAAIINWVATGTTATTLTASYTNSSGTSGRITPSVNFGGAAAANAAGSVYPLPWQNGDQGVRSVESITLAGTTGSVGNFGVILYKPLCMFICNDGTQNHYLDAVSTGHFVGQLAECEPDACLTLLGTNVAASAWSGNLMVCEE